LELKKEAVEIAVKTNNNYESARKIKEKYKEQNLYQQINEKSIRLWRDDPEINKDIEKDYVTRKQEQTRKSCSKYINPEKELVEKIKARRRLGEKVSCWWIKHEAKISFGDPQFTASEGWFRNFRKRWNISKTHVIQKLKEDFSKKSKPILNLLDPKE